MSVAGGSFVFGSAALPTDGVVESASLVDHAAEVAVAGGVSTEGLVSLARPVLAVVETALAEVSFDGAGDAAGWWLEMADGSGSERAESGESVGETAM